MADAQWEKTISISFTDEAGDTLAVRTVGDNVRFVVNENESVWISRDSLDDLYYYLDEVRG